MLLIDKIIKDNKISKYDIADLLGITKQALQNKLNLTKDFTITELEKIKEFLIDLNILNFKYDIGDFLNEVEEEKTS